MTKQYFVYWQR